jgi:PAS domain S-box-containing protein
MGDKPSYEGLEQRARQLEKEVAERKHAGEDLRASEEKWRSLVKNAPSPIITVDRDGIIRDINQAVAGLEIEKVVGTSHYDYALPEYHKVMKESVEQVFKTGNSVSYEIAGVGPEGSTSWYVTGLGPIKRGGEVVGVTIMPRDITERKQAEQELRKVSEEQALLLDNIDTQVWYLTDIETHGAVNRALAEFLGVQKSDIAYKNVYDILSKEEAEVCIAGNREVFESKRQVRTEEWVKNGRGELRLLSVSKTPKLDKEGNVEYVVCAAEDITERKQAEQALRERETALEIQAEELQEVNTALRVLLRQRDKDKTELEEKVFLNVRELVMPQVEKLKKAISDARQKAYLGVLESNLNEIISPFAHRLSSKYSSLTPTEIQMAFLIRDGKTTKEIAELLNLSGRTVESHRQSIRMKMGIRNRKANLRSHLLSM